MNDEKIIDLFWKRDETAIKEADKKYGRYCSTVSMSILHNELDAEECVNDAYLSLWNSIPPHRPQVLRTFLGRIVRNISINRHKSTHRQGHNCYMDVSLEELMDELVDCFPSDDDMTNELSGEIKEYLQAFLREQDALNRKLFVGRYWYSYSISRLSASYGLTEGAVEIRLRRTRTKLKKYLNERGISV